MLPPLLRDKWDPPHMNAVRRTEISAGDTLGFVFEPEAGSDHFVVMLGGSGGGFAEGPAQRLAEHGSLPLRLATTGAPELARDLVEAAKDLAQAAGVSAGRSQALATEVESLRRTLRKIAIALTKAPLLPRVADLLDH